MADNCVRLPMIDIWPAELSTVAVQQQKGLCQKPGGVRLHGVLINEMAISDTLDGTYVAEGGCGVPVGKSRFFEATPFSGS